MLNEIKERYDDKEKKQNYDEQIQKLHSAFETLN
jgi:hypothetical protein